jgi:Reverse transcriptase (RNA-dependent DNA polymerase)
VHSLSDPALYIQKNYPEGSMLIIVIIYVNDLIIISLNIEYINQIKTKLLAKFNMTNLNEIKNLLGIEIL